VEEKTMSIDEVRMRLRRKLEELVGVSGADILMDRPPGGWGDLVTNHTLDLRFDAFEARMDAKMDARFAEFERNIDQRFAQVDARFAEFGRRFDLIDARFDAFESSVLAKVDPSLHHQTWATLSAIIAMMAVVVAAIRL